MNSKYRDIAQKILGDILSSKYNFGEQLPSIRILANIYNANPNTIVKALDILKSEGFISSYRTCRYKVVKDVGQLRKEISQKEIKKFIDNMKLLKISETEILSLVEKQIYKKVKPC